MLRASRSLRTRALPTTGLLVAGLLCVATGTSAAAQGGTPLPTGDPLTDPGQVEPTGGGRDTTGRGAGSGDPGGSGGDLGGSGGLGAGGVDPLDGTPAGEVGTGGDTGAPGGDSPPPGAGGTGIGGTTFSLPQNIPAWELWWDLNRHQYLDWRLANARQLPTTGSSDSFLGDGTTAADALAAADSLPPDLLPVLLLAATDPDPRPASEALIALGELSEHWTAADERLSVRKVLGQRATDSNRLVAQSALLGLSIGAQDEDLGLLGALLLDQELGRSYLGTAEVSPEDRATAALGLGRLGVNTRREDVRRLVLYYLQRGVESAPRNQPSIGATCLVAMAQVPLEQISLRDPAGLPEPASHSRLALLRFLVGQLEGRKRLDDQIAAHLPAAVAIGFDALDTDDRRELERSLSDPVLAILERPRREADATVQNAALAAGALGDWDDDAVDRDLREGLLETLDAADARTRTCALLALGRTLATPGEGPQGEGWDEAAKRLTDIVTRGTSSDRPAAALALGTAAATLRRAGQLVPDRWMIAVRAALAAARTAEERVGLALAAGLMGDSGGEAVLFDAYDRAPAGRERSRIAVAIGLLGSRGALKRLRADFETTLADRASTTRYAEAAALCGDVSLAGRLTLRLGLDPSRIHRIAMVDALAQVGGDSEVAYLVERLADETVDAGERARLARAIGRIADTDPEPWAARYARQLVVPGTTRALFDGEGGGALDRLR